MGHEETITKKCISEIQRCKSLEDANMASGNASMGFYHRGHKEAWLEFHRMIVNREIKLVVE